MTIRKRPAFDKDKRRRHHHFQVVVVYRDGEKFARTYSDRDKANNFAKRQEKSPAVKVVNVVKIS